MSDKNAEYFVQNLLESGTYPPDNLNTEQVLECASLACKKVYMNLTPNNNENIKKYTKNVFKWLSTLPPDIQMCSVRSTFGGKYDTIKNYDLVKIPEFMKIIIGIRQNIKK